MLTDPMGSPLYMAPEVVKNQRYSEKVDVWSACVIVYAMLTGHPPFNGEDKTAMFRAIREQDVQF